MRDGAIAFVYIALHRENRPRGETARLTFSERPKFVPISGTKLILALEYALARVSHRVVCFESKAMIAHQSRRSLPFKKGEEIGRSAIGRRVIKIANVREYANQ
jgi:hypothetical protein